MDFFVVFIVCTVLLSIFVSLGDYKNISVNYMSPIKLFSLTTLITAIFKHTGVSKLTKCVGLF